MHGLITFGDIVKKIILALPVPLVRRVPHIQKKPKTKKPPISTNEYKKRMNKLNIILNDVNKLKKIQLREN